MHRSNDHPAGHRNELEGANEGSCPAEDTNFDPAARLATERTAAAELTEKFANAIAERRLEVPALLFLELHRPFLTIAHTSALFAQPFLTPFFGAEKIEGLLEFLNDRRNIEHLIAKIQQRSSSPVR